MRFTLLLALLATAPAAAQVRQSDEQFYRALQRISAPCADPALDLPSPHVIVPERESRALLRALLKVDASLCPGVVEPAVALLMARVGPGDRADVDLELLRLAWFAAETGRGIAPDRDLADRFGRLLWLFDDDPPKLARLAEPQLQRWALGDEAIALLDARNADSGLRTLRSLQLHADILLRKDHPAYDPAKAASLLEAALRMGNWQGRTHLVALLTAGEHMTPDFARASRVYLSSAARRNPDEESQRALLRIGRAAASAARTPREVAAALRIVAASAIDGRDDSLAAQAALLRRIGSAPAESLAAGQADVISEALDFRFGFDLPSEAEDDPAELRPIVLRGLIGPDGRVAMTELVRSSGSPTRDRIVRGAWVSDGGDVDLSATAKGRFVWVELPAVDPELTTMKVLQRKSDRKEAALLATLAAVRAAGPPGSDAVDQGLADALEALARFYEAESRYSMAEPVVRELAALYPTLRPRALAVERLVYDAWLEKLLRHQGRFDEAKRLEDERLERKKRLDGGDPLTP